MCGHAVLLELPQVDLVEDGGGDDGDGRGGYGGGSVGGGGGGGGGEGARVGHSLFGRGVAAHLRVRVAGQVADYLIGGDALADGALHGRFGEFARDEVGVAGAQGDEEGEERDLERGRCVRVQTVVGLDDDEARARG